MKHSLSFFCISTMILVSLTSCFCPIIEFANQDCIEITKKPCNVLYIESELCYYGSYNKNWNFYQYLIYDGTLPLKKQHIKVNYCGKPLKFKMFCLNQKGWKETETIETGDSVAFMLSYKGKLKEGEVLQVVERNIDLNDSVVTSIQIPSIYHQTYRHLNDSSKLFRHLQSYGRYF